MKNFLPGTEKGSFSDLKILYFLIAYTFFPCIHLNNFCGKLFKNLLSKLPRKILLNLRLTDVDFRVSKNVSRRWVYNKFFFNQNFKSDLENYL